MSGLPQIGVLRDDTPEHYRFGAVDFKVEQGTRRTEIVIAWRRDGRRA